MCECYDLLVSMFFLQTYDILGGCNEIDFSHNYISVYKKDCP